MTFFEIRIKFQIRNNFGCLILLDNVVTLLLIFVNFNCIPKKCNLTLIYMRTLERCQLKVFGNHELPGKMSNVLMFYLLRIKITLIVSICQILR